MSSINIIGAACIDLLIRNVDEDRFFSGSFKAERIISSFGGDALNEALILSKMGLDVKLCSILGDDPNGKLILHELDKNHISYDQNILNKGIDTYISLVFIDSNGERKFVGSENGSLRLLDLDDIKIDEDARIVSFASLFISKVLNDEKLCKLFAYIKENNKILVCDCSKPKNNEDVKDLKCLKYLDYFFCNESEAKRFIIVTESGILHRLRKLVPGKEFIGVGTEKCSCAECEYMKLNTLEKIRNCLLDMTPEVRVPEELRLRAEKPLLRMLELSK